MADFSYQALADTWNPRAQSSTPLLDGLTANQYVAQNFPANRWVPQEIQQAAKNLNGPKSALEVLDPFILLHALKGMDTSRKDGDAMDFSPNTWLPPSRYRFPENI